MELVLRFISCDKKLAFVKNWLNIIDLIAILPYYLMLTASKAAIGKTSMNEFSRRYLPCIILGASTNFGSTLKIFRLTRIVRVAKMRFLFFIVSFISRGPCHIVFYIYDISYSDYKSYFEFLIVIKLFPVITYPCHNSLPFDTNANTACYHSVVFGSW